MKKIFPIVFVLSVIVGIFFVLKIQAKERIVIDPQVDLQKQLSKNGMVYEIKSDIDLEGQMIELPLNCVLDFNGGSLFNGSIKGKIGNEYLCPEWFGAKGDGITDDTEPIRQCISLTNKIIFSKKRYCIKSRTVHDVFLVDHDLEVDGNGATLVLPEELYKDYNSSIWLFHNEESKKVKHNYYHDFNIEVKVNKTPEFKGNFYMFNLYAEDINISNVNISNKGKYNNLNAFTVCYAKDIKIQDCNVENESLSTIGGGVWVMMKDKPDVGKTNIQLRNCRFFHDAKDETICFSSSQVNKTDCDIRFEVSDCEFVSPNKVKGSGFLILYDNRKDSGCHYQVEGTVSNCRFLSKRNDSLPDVYRRVLSIQRAGNTPASWKVGFKNCEFVDMSSYKHINGDDGRWDCNYMFGLPSYKVGKDNAYSIKISDSKIKTNNSVFNAYTGGTVADVVLDNCDVECKALRLSNANSDVCVANVMVEKCRIKTDFPYSFGGNEVWHDCEITSPSYDFFLVPFSKNLNLKKQFTKCGINGTQLHVDVKNGKNEMHVRKYCSWKHPIFNQKTEVIDGILATEASPRDAKVSNDLVIKGALNGIKK
ncbi:MAG: hypothetical protein K6F48_08810 [Paludibacteraceae bacterium]|nr:hypothetical protein [Paludibacteraceae bacterium]